MQHLSFFAHSFAKDTHGVGKHLHTSRAFHAICLIIVLVWYAYRCRFWEGESGEG